MSRYWKLGFPNFPFFEVRILLLRNIIAAKPMVRFGFPKHQKVYRGHKMVPCEFRTQPQPTRKLAQLPQPSPNEKWKPLAPHQLLKKSKNVFWFFSYEAETFLFRTCFLFSLGPLHPLLASSRILEGICDFMTENEYKCHYAILYHKNFLKFKM